MTTKYDKVNDRIASEVTNAQCEVDAESGLWWDNEQMPSAHRRLMRAQVHMLSAISCQLTKMSDQLNDINRAGWAEVKIMKQGGDDDA